MKNARLFLLILLTLTAACQQQCNKKPQSRSVATRPAIPPPAPAASQQKQEAEQIYTKILAASVAISPHGVSSEDEQWWNKMCEKVKTIVSQVNDPVVLREVIVMVRSRTPACSDPEMIGCTACDMTCESYTPCMGRLVELGTDEAARDLVNLLRIPECHWDACPAEELVSCITQIKRKALPHLEPLEGTNTLAKECDGCIRRGEVLTH